MQGNQKSICTKIDKQSCEMFEAIANKFGMKRYKMLQIVIDAYIKAFCTYSYITDSMREIIATFAQFRLGKDSFALCKGTTDKLSFTKCIALITEKGKAFPQAVLLKAPEKAEDDVIITRNNDEILKCLLMAINPDLLPELTKLQKQYKLHSLCAALRYAVNEQAEGDANTIEAEVRELFADNQRNEYGQVTDYAAIGRYKRKPRHQLTL